LLGKGEMDRAIADFDRALKLKPLYGDALTARGAALLKKNDYARALADLDKATSLDQANAESYYVRARVYEAQGKSDLAIADLRKASEFSPKSVFEVMAQASAKKRIQELTKTIPCSAPGEGGSCL
jgi:tetratricopeptide (TPR) repeat protein